MSVLAGPGERVEGRGRGVADAGAVVGGGLVHVGADRAGVRLDEGGVGRLAALPLRVERVDVAVAAIVAVVPPDERLPFAVAVLLLALALDLPELVQAVDDDGVVGPVARLELLERLVGVHPADLRDPGGRPSAVQRGAGPRADGDRDVDVDEHLPADLTPEVVERHHSPSRPRAGEEAARRIVWSNQAYWSGGLGTRCLVMAIWNSIAGSIGKSRSVYSPLSVPSTHQRQTPSPRVGVDDQR